MRTFFYSTFILRNQIWGPCTWILRTLRYTTLYPSSLKSSEGKSSWNMMIKKYAYSSIGISLVVIFMCFQYNSETTVRKGKHWNILKRFLFQITSLPESNVSNRSQPVIAMLGKVSNIPQKKSSLNFQMRSSKWDLPSLSDHLEERLHISRGNPRLPPRVFLPLRAARLQRQVRWSHFYQIFSNFWNIF